MKQADDAAAPGSFFVRQAGEMDE